MAAHGVAPDNADQLLVTAGKNHDHHTNEAPFAILRGIAPSPPQ